MRRQERENAVQASLREVEQQRSIRVAERSQRISNLDQTIDQLKAKFADTSIALQYDANALTNKYVGGTTHTNPNNDDTTTTTAPTKRVSPCLGPRAHWLDCTKKYLVDTRPCDAYLTALENCVNEAIVTSNNSSKH